MTKVREKINLKVWAEQAFRNDIPTQVRELLERRQTSANVLEEMMTQWDPQTRKAVESLYDLHRQDTALIYAVVQKLFERHLEDHPR